MTMKILALDIGNVCIRINLPNVLYAIGLERPTPELLQCCGALECGKCTEEEFYAGLDRITGSRFTREELKSGFNSILIEPVPRMDELVRIMPEMGIKPVFFSDISMIHLARARELFPAAEVVPDGVYSFDVGAMKPSAAMLTAFEKRFGKPALYVDDRAELIEAARASGWNSLVFSGAENLKAELEKIVRE